jgi:hypothetical protein
MADLSILRWGMVAGGVTLMAALSATLITVGFFLGGE